jgi:hypothetical protein
LVSCPVARTNSFHFPYLYESAGGNWYLTYREGPHLDRLSRPGNTSSARGYQWPSTAVLADPL